MTQTANLTGSTAQVTWAQRIQAGLPAEVDRRLARFADDIAAGFRQILLGVAARQTSASWWIDERDTLWLALLDARNDDERARVRELEALGRARRAAAQTAPATRELTARELAAELGVSLTTAYRRCRSGAVTATKTSAGRWAITVPAA